MGIWAAERFKKSPFFSEMLFFWWNLQIFVKGMQSDWFFIINHNKHNGGVTTIENVKKEVFKISEERAPY
jgi:hypothetical protein